MLRDVFQNINHSVTKAKQSLPDWPLLKMPKAKIEAITADTIPVIRLTAHLGSTALLVMLPNWVVHAGSFRCAWDQVKDVDCYVISYGLAKNPGVYVKSFEVPKNVGIVQIDNLPEGVPLVFSIRTKYNDTFSPYAPPLTRTLPLTSGRITEAPIARALTVQGYTRAIVADAVAAAGATNVSQLPTNPVTKGPMQLSTSTDKSNLYVAVSGSPGQGFVLQRAERLPNTNWAEVGIATIPDSGIWQWSVALTNEPAAPSGGFFRTEAVKIP